MRGFEDADEGIRPADHQALCCVAQAHGSSHYGQARRECILHHSAFILSAELASVWAFVLASFLGTVSCACFSSWQDVLLWR